jgi:hypothetical protein
VRPAQLFPRQGIRNYCYMEAAGRMLRSLS